MRCVLLRKDRVACKQSTTEFSLDHFRVEPYGFLTASINIDVKEDFSLTKEIESVGLRFIGMSDG